jgi:DNA-binding MarR family transcriptional regulator
MELARAGNGTKEALAEALGISGANAWNALASLEKRGWLKREPDRSFSVTAAGNRELGDRPKTNWVKASPPPAKAPAGVPVVPGFNAEIALGDPILAPMVERRAQLVRQIAGIDAALAAYRDAQVG